MKTGDGRILVTHTGSLPRPSELALPGTPAALGGDTATDDDLREAVTEIVAAQVDAGVDVVNDGEISKPSYSTYVTSRLTGFEEGPTSGRPLFEARDFPEYFARMTGSGPAIRNQICTGAVAYRDHDSVQRDIANLKSAAASTSASELFMTAASPGVIAQFMANEFYPSHDAYVGALADAMKEEYDAIHAAGIILQVDCPDLASWQVAEAKGHDKAQFRRTIAQNVEALNHATRDIPPEAMRMHVCWGNYMGPHTHDVPLVEIIDLILPVRPSGLLFEAANPRHEHEWVIFEDIDLPDGKVLIPGVLDSTTNYVEHPELVAQRLERLAAIVGRENIVAGTDCGFATFAHSALVDPRIVWAKMAAMAEGARIASDRLWASPS
jgi:5-methyltetrahydropteroyltriglutamate--homocysteine methyltransferase